MHLHTPFVFYMERSSVVSDYEVKGQRRAIAGEEGRALINYPLYNKLAGTRSLFCRKWMLGWSGLS